MAGQNYYLITSLPALGELGSDPPTSAAELIERVVESGGAAEIVRALLLSDDLLQREALASGEIAQAAGAVLDEAQLRNEAPLPPELAPPADGDPAGEAPIPADAVWAAYYRWVAATADRTGSDFLADWVRHEVTLRNALAAARAKKLGLEVQPYLVATELAGDAEDYTALLNEWSSAPHPLAATRALDNARWAWLAENDRWFTFHNDELAAYAAKLMVLVRWHRLTKGSPSAVSADAAPTSSERTSP